MNEACRVRNLAAVVIFGLLAGCEGRSVRPVVPTGAWDEGTDSVIVSSGDWKAAPIPDTFVVWPYGDRVRRLLGDGRLLYSGSGSGGFSERLLTSDEVATVLGPMPADRILTLQADYSLPTAAETSAGGSSTRFCFGLSTGSRAVGVSTLDDTVDIGQLQGWNGHVPDELIALARRIESLSVGGIAHTPKAYLVMVRALESSLEQPWDWPIAEMDLETLARSFASEQQPATITAPHIVPRLHEWASYRGQTPIARQYGKLYRVAVGPLLPGPVRPCPNN